MNFDLNSLRSIVTVISLLIFVCIVVWAFSQKQSDDFEQASQLPFEQD